MGTKTLEVLQIIKLNFVDKNYEKTLSKSGMILVISCMNGLLVQKSPRLLDISEVDLVISRGI